MTSESTPAEPIETPPRRTWGWQVLLAGVLLLAWNGFLAWLAIAG